MPRRTDPLHAAYQRARERDRRAEQARRASTEYGVFHWRADARYPRERAVRIFQREAAADNYARTYNQDHQADGTGYVVRRLDKLPRPEQQ